ncbi:DsbA family protein [Streptomyces fuscigenes]|uniref:DsbA family protein n=1 Tax=Streptomyces fuscigenes TaxID=1528880 RepID=UPI001F1B6522|nr:thioredoxin domain-containing protein [Streptomyces fuscigenes]MCF3964094.1 DsbA family protein [Streptomyces fuscigenes]
MSQKTRGATSARERIQQERAAEKAREKRRRGFVVGGVALAVLAFAGGIGVLAANAGKDKTADGAAGPVSTPTGAGGKDGLAISVGAADAPSTLTVWEDFRCPICGQFENVFRGTFHQLEKSGQLKIEYHLATIIDGNMGGTGSVRAANAAACAQDAGRFPQYHDALYENQPEETSDAFGKNSRLLEIAAKVPGLSTPAFKSCVENGSHDAWVKKSADAFRTSGYAGTPTVLLNGKPVFPKKGDENISPANLKKWVAEANKGKRPGTARPSGA